MAGVRLTDSAITAAANRAIADGIRIELADAGERGLNLRITPAGARSWVLRVRDGEGHSRRVLLGSHPGLGLAEARGKAREAREAVRGGANPIEERRQIRKRAADAAVGVGTLAALLDTYTKQRPAPRSFPECRRRIESVFANFLGKPLSSLQRKALQQTADAWPSAQSAAAAIRCLRPVLNWAAIRELCSADLAALRPPVTARARARVLTADELSSLLPVLGASTRPYAAALHFMLLTLARREEVGAARWRDVRLDGAKPTWRIPTTKNGTEHQVPLPRQAVSLLRSRGPGAPDSLVFATETSGRLVNWDRETKAIQTASSTTGWQRHDLRRTGATLLGELGIVPAITEAALNHAAIHSRFAATYNKSTYRPQVAEALQRLADHLDALEHGGAEIIPLHPVKA